MNIVRIVSKKIPKKNLNEIYLPLSSLQNTLTEAAKTHNDGYISSQSYFPISLTHNDYPILYNISEWKSHNYWIDWLNSETRKNIYSSYDILDDEEHIILRARIPFNDFPLL